MVITDLSDADLARLGAEAGAEARAKTWALGRPITIGDETHIVRIWPDGRKEVVRITPPAAAE